MWTNRKSYMVYQTAPFSMTLTQTQISRSDHSLRLNISEMAKGTAMEGEWETVPKLSHDTIFSDFE